MAEDKKISKRGRVGEGAPPKYRPEYCDLLIAHMSEGYSFDTFAYKIPDKRVVKRTLYNWRDEYPEFLHSMQRAQDACKHYWETVGKGLINGEIKGSVAGWIFWMKCRFGWNDVYIDVSTIPTEQLKDLVRRALEKLEEEEKNEG